MRDYAKLAPTFWTGETGKALRRRGSEAVIVALYLVSSPHSNMLGLYYQPIPYMGHETGLGEEGARKGLQSCIDVGFCSYDADAEMVFVHEMAAWQIADALSSGDKRCKGIQKDYDALPHCAFLGSFFDRYATAFHLKNRRSNTPEKPQVSQAPSQAPPEAHRSQEQEQEQDPSGSGAKAPAAVAAPLREPNRQPMTDRERVWSLGVPLLGESARGLLGKLAKAHGEDVVAAVLAEATLAPPAEPRAWVTAACVARGKPKPANGRHSEAQTTRDLLDRDPHAGWAIGAGFPDIFAAESAGCGPGNAHKFHDGRREP